MCVSTDRGELAIHHKRFNGVVPVPQGGFRNERPENVPSPILKRLGHRYNGAVDGDGNPDRR